MERGRTLINEQRRTHQKKILSAHVEGDFSTCVLREEGMKKEKETRVRKESTFFGARLGALGKLTRKEFSINSRFEKGDTHALGEDSRGERGGRFVPIFKEKGRSM